MLLDQPDQGAQYIDKVQFYTTDNAALRLRRNELWRNRGGFSSKIHLLIDFLGLPLQFILNGGERYDLG